MISKPKAFTIALLTLWSVLFTAVTFVFGGVFLRPLRLVAGDGVYWPLGIFVSGLILILGWPLYALAYFGLILLVGVFSDLEERGLGLTMAGLISSVFLFATGGAVFGFWVYRNGSGWFDRLSEKLAESLTVVMAGRELPIPAPELLRHAPSIIFIVFGLALFFALLFERRLLRVFSVGVSTRQRLTSFRLPDIFIWILIPSFLVTFGKFEKIESYKWIASNIFNMCFFLYFLQGLAVVMSFFRRLRMAPFWQALLGIILSLQLFVFVGLLGVVDYWTDFRKKLTTEGPELKKPFIKNK